MKKTIVLIAGFGLFLVIVVLFFNAYLNTVRCRKVLISQLNNFRQYRLDHKGHYPLDISVLSQAIEIGTRSSSTSEPLPRTTILLSCPGVRRRPILIAEANTQSDYIYINWEQFYGTNDVPAEYPIVYDRSLSNHFGRGVNVITFGGGCFWDRGAKWLKQFAADHPSFKVIVPN